MININELFFELIRVAIGTQDSLSRIPSNREWKELYDMAQKQSLVGVCFAGLQKLGADADVGFARIGMSEMLYFTWLGMAAKIQQKNESVNQQCAELQAKLSADGYRSYIMKGQSVASLYQDLSVLRQSGDIDVYIEGGFDKVYAYAKTFGVSGQVNELEIHVSVFEDTEVEFHYRPFIMRNPIRNAKLQKFFKECEEVNFSNSVILDKDRNLSIYGPTTEFNLVHQLVHIYHHFITGGVGMRQLMDYYFVLRAANIENSEGPNMFQKVSNVTKSLGLQDFAFALIWVIQHVFGLGMIGMPWVPNKRNGELLLNEVLITGNFGHSDNRTKGLLENKWKSFWYFQGMTWRFWRFDHWGWFWSPLWRTYHYVWRKINGFK